MAGEPIDRLNHWLLQFKQNALSGLPGLQGKAIDIAMVEFNDEAKVIQNFAPIEKMEPPTLTAK